MALLLQEGFDHYTTVANFILKWTEPAGTIGSVNQTGRWPAQGSAVASLAYLTTNSNGVEAYRTLSAVSSNTVWLGCAVKPGSLSFSGTGCFPIGTFDTASNTFQICFAFTNTGAIQIYRGGGPNAAQRFTTLLGTSPGGLFSVGTWTYFEAKIVFSTSATGSVSIYINGSTTASYTISSVQTATTNAQFDTLYINSSFVVGTSHTIDDIYVCDNTTSINNTQLGDVKVVTTMPASAGRLTGAWAQTGGTGGLPATAVNEANPDGDTSYLSDATPGDIQDFVQASAGTIGATLFGVSINAYARKDDAGARVLGLGVGNGTTENFDSGHTLGATYVCYTRCMSSNPLTSAAWAVSDPATLQSSIKEIS